ncbi:urease accessory protein UreD [Rhodococcus sp. MEB064]|uniref:urease accessory protein UreD n=1 Tax=Rhodococcus sp. MEB064 TaxID=1587522 RepID=UPI002F417112
MTIVASRARTPRIEARGGLAVRRTGAHRVHLIGSAATPLGGDTIEVRIVVEAGARLEVCTVAASVALPGRITDVSHARWSLEVHDGGDLVFDPEPTIVAGSAEHHSTVGLHLGTGSRAVVRERVQLGRTGEHLGRWTGTFDVDTGTTPVLRHRLDLGPGADGHDALFAPMAAMSTLTWPSTALPDATGDVRSALDTTMPMAGGGTLSTWLGHRLPVVQPARLAPADSAEDGSAP